MRAQMDGIRGIGGAEVHAAQLEIVCGDINRIVDGEGGTGFFRHILLPLPHFFPARKTGRSGHGKNAAVDKGQTGGFQIRSDAFNQVVQVGAVRQSVFDAGNVPCVSFPPVATPWLSGQEHVPAFSGLPFRCGRYGAI